MVDSLSLLVRYALFALIATIGNILTQDIYIYLDSGQFSLYSSILLGTIVGLLIKYFLDKKYVFKYETASKKRNAQMFFLYSVMGIFTTLIFWGVELAFHYIFATKEMRYFGGVLGLIIGYIVKYNLDQRYVFID